MSAPRKEHVIEGSWQTGAFHVVRFLVCRCGWRGEHYSAGRLREMFAEHKEAVIADGGKP